eukprot:m.63823 g.63823  ORF g.63823 m.63823 type:complete len:749 (+) comp11967_c0_seq2:93-2339(+)
MMLHLTVVSTHCVVALAVVVCAGSFMVHAVPTDYTADSKSVFPYLYFDQEDVPELKRKLEDTSLVSTKRLRVFQATPWSGMIAPESMDEFRGIWNERWGNSLPPMALLSLLDATSEGLAMRTKTFESMDNMARFDLWTVAALPKDEVPVAHSLVGFATAFDFLYQVMSTSQRRRYARAIVHHTLFMQDRVVDDDRWWAYVWLQNHVFTNCHSIFIGCLMTERMMLDPELKSYLEVEFESKLDMKAITELKYKMMHHFGRMFDRLNTHVKDGSMDEGVYYTLYSTRSLFEHIHISHRHHLPHIVNLDSGIWFKNHINFMIKTVHRGFDEVLPFADSENFFSYGPEMQMRALDRYVLRNGHGNWLADLVGTMRMDEKNQRLIKCSVCSTTLHSDFLIHDLSLKPIRPEIISSKPDLYHFEDWGVVVVGYGMLDPNVTTLAVKCGATMGAAFAAEITAQTSPEFVPRNVNAGHEHPDQGSFVFFPHGRPFITSSSYTLEKLTALENTLTFSVGSKEAQQHYGCKNQDNQVGQVGECGHWLDWAGVYGFHQTLKQHWPRIESAEKHGILSRISANLEPAYMLPGLDQLTRVFYQPDSDVLFIVDQVHTSSRDITRVHQHFFSDQWIVPLRNQEHRLLALTPERDQVFTTRLDMSKAASIQATASVTDMSSKLRGKFEMRRLTVNHSLEPGYTAILTTLVAREVPVIAVRARCHECEPTFVLGASQVIMITLELRNGESKQYTVVTPWRSHTS